MKIAPRQVDSFIRSPDIKARVIIIYGPNDGLVKERSNLIGKTIIDDLNDPFNACSLTNDKIIEDPAILDSEANSFSMMGGSRLIRITQASDKITAQVKSYLENPSLTNLVIIEASNMPPKSPLRKLCETSTNAASIACYDDDARDTANLIREILQDEGMNAAPDAINFLSNNLNGNRQKVRSELEKLVIYKGNDKNITLKDANDCCGESGTSEIDELINAIASKNPKLAQKTYQNLIQEGISVIMIIRMLQNHFKRLYITKCKIEQGTPPDAAMKSLYPPIFFKNQQIFSSQLNKHNTESLERTLSRLTELESQTKQSAMPIETITGQAIIGISLR